MRLGLLRRLGRALQYDRVPDLSEDGPCAECGSYVRSGQGERTRLGIFCCWDHAETFWNFEHGW